RVLRIEGIEHCLESLDNWPDALLIIDWNRGLQDIVRVLAQTKAFPYLDRRPILLFALNETQEEIEQIASEFEMTVTHTGPITLNYIRNTLHIIQDDPDLQSIEATLQNVVEGRIERDWARSDAALKKLHQDIPHAEWVRAEWAENLLNQG